MTRATLLFADVNLSVSNVLWWLVIGLVAGFLASRVMRGGGYGVVGDIIVGLIGAFIGGWLAGFLGIGGSSSLIVSIIIAFIGACILIAIFRAVSRGGASRSRRWGRRSS
ncbi:MAG TPA: GlsB/YeaQ/YmgE family stress response membrane protein [Ktedonobacteraceae bacterium]|nr:GlsB/YeaQ/YmgE family stress response membrane protein [Ktedonobacteraceae bacterium]